MIYLLLIFMKCICFDWENQTRDVFIWTSTCLNFVISISVSLVLFAFPYKHNRLHAQVHVGMLVASLYFHLRAISILRNRRRPLEKNCRS